MFEGKEYVYEVYKEKSFSKAAKKLYISQPSLSATIKRIEDKIGYQIFDRSTKPLSLTEYGEKYIYYTEEIMEKETEFSDYINDLENLRTGKLVLGGSSLFSSWILPPLMKDFTSRFPKVKVAVVEETTVQLTHMLNTGEIDLMIDNGILDHTVFEKRIYQEEHLILAVPKHLSVNEKMKKYIVSEESIRDGSFLQGKVKTVPMEAFRDEAFIMLKPDNDTRKRAIEICESAGFTPNVVFELDQQMTAYNVTSSGLGISFIGDSLIKRVPPNPNVYYYRVGRFGGRRELYFYWKRGRYLSRSMQEFLDMVESE